ncbi:hypothetical protein CSX01_03320 [Pseudobutyrivibrio ruminis]|uniref:Uncharacterized protein n=2 Tax=Pseudobutyrivibrio ruminis TaxID=46206 RepID=A0A2G3DXB0_9FIRM|nr:hypothetical protein CSX01_03320 [Pseudobutyrivibrio ruminis]
MPSRVMMVVITIILSVIISYFLYFKVLHSRLKVSFPIFLCIVIVILSIVGSSIITIDMKKDMAEHEYEMLVIQITNAETYDDFERAYNNAVDWLDKTNSKLIDGATKEERDAIKEYVEYYKKRFQ